MSQKENQADNKVAGLIPVTCSVLLIGATAAPALWQFKSWNNILILAQFIFFGIVLGIIGGVLWEGFLGKGKGVWSNLMGIAFLFVLLWICSPILEHYNILARESFTTWEKTVKMLSFGICAGVAVIGGKDIARRYLKKAKS